MGKLGADCPLLSDFRVNFVDFVDIVWDVVVSVEDFILVEPHLEEDIPEFRYEELGPVRCST